MKSIKRTFILGALSLGFSLSPLGVMESANAEPQIIAHGYGAQINPKDDELHIDMYWNSKGQVLDYDLSVFVIEEDLVSKAKSKVLGGKKKKKIADIVYYDKQSWNPSKSSGSLVYHTGDNDSDYMVEKNEGIHADLGKINEYNKNKMHPSKVTDLILVVTKSRGNFTGADISFDVSARDRQSNFVTEYTFQTSSRNNYQAHVIGKVSVHKGRWVLESINKDINAHYYDVKPTDLKDAIKDLINH